MESVVQIFEHEQFGKVRVVMIDSEPWFVAADVCKALELKNSRDAIARLDNDEKRTAFILTRGVALTDTQGNYQCMNVVNEPDLYRLIFASKKPEAKKFQRWVYHEVLPSIRKTGSYSVLQAAAPALKPAPNPARVEGQRRDAFVYVLLMSDGTVKIGQSSNVRNRTTEIERQTGLTAQKVYFTPKMSREDARLIEWACQKNFSSRRVKGEFFSVAFAEACAVVDSFAKVLTAPHNSKLIAAVPTKLIADKKLD